MSVKIEMDMPKSCMECMFHKSHISTNKKAVSWIECNVFPLKPISFNTEKRAKDCPLKEVKE